MRYLPQLLRDLRKLHKGWKITIIDYDGEHYDDFILSDKMTEYDNDPAYSEVEIEDWEIEDDVDEAEITLFSNIEPTF